MSCVDIQSLQYQLLGTAYNLIILVALASGSWLLLSHLIQIVRFANNKIAKSIHLRKMYFGLAILLTAVVMWLIGNFILYSEC